MMNGLYLLSFLFWREEKHAMEKRKRGKRDRWLMIRDERGGICMVMRLELTDVALANLRLVLCAYCPAKPYTYPFIIHYSLFIDRAWPARVFYFVTFTYARLLLSLVHTHVQCNLLPFSLFHLTHSLTHYPIVHNFKNQWYSHFLYKCDTPFVCFSFYILLIMILITYATINRDWDLALIFTFSLLKIITIIP